MKGVTSTMNISPKTIAVPTLTALCVALAAACAPLSSATPVGSPSAEPPTVATPTVTSVATGADVANVTDGQFGTAGQAVVERANATLLTTDAGGAWQSLNAPGQRVPGHSVDVHGGTVVAAATIDASGAFTYQRSSDTGKTWASQHLSLPSAGQPMQADVFISGDGSTVAIAAALPHSMGVRGQSSLFVGPAGQSVAARTMPIAGTASASWVGKHLVAIGGPLASEMFVSDDLGATWTQDTVAGVKVADDAPVPADAPSIGLPVALTDTYVIPVTVTRGSASFIDVLATTDGRNFTTLGEVSALAPIAAGVAAVGTSAGPDMAIFADPSSTALISVTGSEVTTIMPTGLPGIVSSLTFSDATHGLAMVSTSTCPDKVNCTTTTGLYSSSDGGRTWVPSQPPAA